jgi:UDP-N-acetylglucosamine:LPS N-acetylglucosamine transferase
MSTGTTELNCYPYPKKIKKYNYKIEPLETFKLIGAAKKPSAVIGRPGLGTIRDCLAAGIIFIPYLRDYDPELESNILSLKNLSLVSSISLSALSFESDIHEIMSDKHIINSWRNTWSDISESSSIVCEQILNLST